MQLYPTFTPALQKAYPKLTKQEVKLCQLLRTGLRSHEAARYMGITERGVETHRLRIRRKLGLKESDNITEFLKGVA